MKATNQSSILQIIPLMLTMALLCPFAYGKIIYVDDDGQADYSNIQFAIDDANDGDVILVRSGIYNILSDIVVDVNCSLVIDPGTRMQFAPSTGLTIQGVLQAQGTVDQKIVFTSKSKVPIPGDWSGIMNYGFSKGMSMLDCVEISFAEIGLDIKAEYGSPRMVVQNSEIHDNSLYGINIESRPKKHILADDVQILKNRIYSNTKYGIYLKSYANDDSGSRNSSYVGGNEICYNSESGIRLYADSGQDVRIPPVSSIVASEITGNHIKGNQYGISTSTKNAYLNRPTKMQIAASITNNVITGNTAYGFSLIRGSHGILYPRVNNNTIVGNSLGGILHHQQPSEGFVISNNIISGNGIGVESKDTFDPATVIDCLVAYNNVFGNENGNWINYPDAYGDLVGINQNGSSCDIAMNVSVDPCFVDSSYWDPNGTLDDPKDDFWVEGDYRLTPCSPCIDSGDPNYIGEPDETDLDGNPRVIGGWIDMGAYEYPFIYDKPGEGSPPGSWWKYSENPVFSEGGPGEWDYRIKSISLLKDHEELVAKYKMWYIGGETPFFEGAGIGYATSTDGINWIRNENNPVLEPREPWNADGFSGICVIKDGPIYKLWYEGSDNDGIARIGYAISSDGINWDINNSNPVFSPGDNDAWDNEDVGNPCVVKEGSTYKMWYWGDNVLTGIDQIGLAFSNDGIHWQRAGSEPVIAPDPSIWWQDGEGIGTPHVLRFNSGYVMAYHAADQLGTIRIGLATSIDGLEWKKEHNPILDIGADNSWDSISVITGSLIQDASHLKLWYLGIDASEIIKVGLAVSCDNIVFDIEADN